MTPRTGRLHVGAAGAGALLATLVTLCGAIPGSAAHLEVDGGVLQTFVFDGPGSDDGAGSVDDSAPETAHPDR